MCHILFYRGINEFTILWHPNLVTFGNSITLVVSCFGNYRPGHYWHFELDNFLVVRASSVPCRRFSSISGFSPLDASSNPSNPLGTKSSLIENHYCRHTCWFYTAGLKVDPTLSLAVWGTSPVFAIWGSKVTQRQIFGSKIYFFLRLTRFWGDFQETLKLALGFWIAWLVNWSVHSLQKKKYWAPAICHSQCWWYVCCCVVFVTLCSELVGGKPVGRPVKMLLGVI